MSNENVTTRKFIVSICKAEKWSDPRELQIDLSPDWVNTKEHPDKSVHSDRVMPMVNFVKFCNILKRKTKTFKAINDSHFFVSGYYALHFYLKNKTDRMKMKKMVIEAVIESGGFMSFDDWYKEHQKKHTIIVQYNGTGSGIRQTINTTPFAFL